MSLALSNEFESLQRCAAAAAASFLKLPSNGCRGSCLLRLASTAAVCLKLWVPRGLREERRRLARGIICFHEMFFNCLLWSTPQTHPVQFRPTQPKTLNPKTYTLKPKPLQVLFGGNADSFDDLEWPHRRSGELQLLPLIPAAV